MDSGFDLGDALREQLGTPDGVPTGGGVVGAVRPADRLILEAYRNGLTGTDEGAAADVAWLDGVLSRQGEWTETAWTSAVRQVSAAGLMDGAGLTPLGHMQVKGLISRFRP